MAARTDRGGQLVRMLAAAAILASLAAALAYRPSAGVDPSRQAERPLRVVVHVDFAQTTHERMGLANVTNILKAAGDDGLKVDVEVVCHAEGIRLVEKSRTELADDVTGLIERGVRFVACANTMRQRSLAPGDLVPGVGIVPSGAYEIVRRQQDGYSYFKP